MIKILKEAFRAGKAGEMMEKVASVIGKQIGDTILISPEPYDYQNKYGKFSGYFGIIGDGDRMLRFNVLLGKSDQISSVDIYNNVSSTEPDLTLLTPGYNIVQIINEVVQALTGKAVKERGVPGSKESPLHGAEIEDFKELMKISSEDIFEQLKDFVYLVHKGMAKSLYVYGKPGTGKSRTVVDTLNTLKSKYELFSGGVKGTSELIRLLYRYSDGVIIVFDDFDSAMKNKEQKNILKVALQDEGERIITYVKDVKDQRTIPEQFPFRSKIIFISNESKIDSAIQSRSLNIKIDLSEEEILLRIKDVIYEIYPEFPIEIKLKIWRFLMRAAKEKKLKRIDFRQFKFCLMVSALILDKHPSSQKWKIKCLAMLNA